MKVEGVEIRFAPEKDGDFLSLTDLTQNFEGGSGLIEKWLRNRNTVEFLGMWEKIYNPAFDDAAFQAVFNEAGLNRSMLSVKGWTEKTAAIGIQARAGRYGGTFAHKDIALEFCTWLSPMFKLYVVREFDRLKQAENDHLALDWSVKRMLARVNWRLHADTVRSHLVPPRLAGSRGEGLVHASEADLLNLALFGMTAREWAIANAGQKGNLRDHATAEQLLVLANLETLNAQFIKEGLAQDERLQRLNETAIQQLNLLASFGSADALALRKP